MWRPEITATPMVMRAEQRQRKRQLTLPQRAFNQHRVEALTEASFKDLHLSP